MKRINYLTQNKKMKMSSEKIYNFGIPAFKESSGKLTCPFAGECAKACYAQMGAYVWSNVTQAFQKRYELTLSHEFVDTIDAEIKRRKIKFVRIHDSGDFYSKEYVNKWYEIMQRNPNVKFYAYTKSLLFFINEHGSYRYDIPDNFKVIFSYGGKLDHLIIRTIHAHSVVFSNEIDLYRYGYSNAVNDDAVAINEHFIGLVYHGYKGQKRLDNWASVNPNTQLDKVG